MLEALDLSVRLPKENYKKSIDKLILRVGEIQRRARESGLPIAAAFEGWDAAGKGTMINDLMLALDPRGFKVYPISAPTQEELLRPWLWRFWTKTPAKGRIVIFDRSWYGRVLVERVDKLIGKKDLSQAYEDINTFERQLTDDGTVIIKFFLHISKEEQARRFDELSKSKTTAWKVTPDDRRHHKQYARYYAAIEEMLEQTDTGNAPWHLVEAHDRKFAIVKILTVFADSVEKMLNSPATPTVAHLPNQSNTTANRNLSPTILRKADLSRSLTRKQYDTQLDKLQPEMMRLEHAIFRKRIPVVIVYEGWDAAGKGGNIKRLVQGMDPRGYEVVPIAAPTDVEMMHHYLWRFWNEVPKAGHITIFDRSWYGRVLVERVEGFCTEQQWKRAFREINEMEEHWARSKMVICKFWLQIDKDEQLRRFKAREKTPHKKWKITAEDYRNREKWDAYEVAVNEMIMRTSTARAPWTIVEANDKLYARIKVLKTVSDRIGNAIE